MLLCCLGFAFLFFLHRKGPCSVPLTDCGPATPSPAESATALHSPDSHGVACWALRQKKKQNLILAVVVLLYGIPASLAL